jgi:hypothetical protein
MSSLDLIWETLAPKEQIRVLRHEQLDLILRVGEMERKFGKIRPSLCLQLLSVLKEIGSIKEWLIGLSLLALLLKGSISPADIKALFLSVHGGGSE